MVVGVCVDGCERKLCRYGGRGTLRLLPHHGVIRNAYAENCSMEWLIVFVMCDIGPSSMESI